MSTKQYKSKLNNFNKTENGVNSGEKRSFTIPLRDTAVFRHCDCIRFIERNRCFKPTARLQYNTIKKICQTKKVGNVQVSSLKIRGSGQNSNFENNVTQSAVDVKTKYSRQRLGDAWEDIRTKMYENQVHEDIINEVEEQIGKLRHAIIKTKNRVLDVHGTFYCFETHPQN